MISCPGRVRSSGGDHSAHAGAPFELCLEAGVSFNEYYPVGGSIVKLSTYTHCLKMVQWAVDWTGEGAGIFRVRLRAYYKPSWYQCR